MRDSQTTEYITDSGSGLKMAWMTSARPYLIGPRDTSTKKTSTVTRIETARTVFLLFTMPR